MAGIVPGNRRAKSRANFGRRAVAAWMEGIGALQARQDRSRKKGRSPTSSAGNDLAGQMNRGKITHWHLER